MTISKALFSQHEPFRRASSDGSRHWRRLGAEFEGRKNVRMTVFRKKFGDLIITGSPHTRRDPATAIVLALKSSAVYSCLYVFDEKNHYSIE